MIEVLNLSALALRNCIRKLFQAFVLILFFGSVFILLGKQLYKGVLTQKCVILPPENITDAEYAAYVSNSSNWLESKNGYYLCGNNTGSRPCPQNYTCLKGADVNTYISNFNFYGSSVVTISQLMTLHFWQELYQRMLLTAGTLHVTYFILAFYSFLYSSGLILAVITRSYRNVLKEFQVIEKSHLLKKDSGSRCDVQKGIVKSPSCKSYELFSSQIITSDRVERQASEIIECSSRSTDKSFDSEKNLKDHVAESKHKREVVRCQLASEKNNDGSETSGQQSGLSACLRKIRNSLKLLMSNCVTELFFLLAIAAFLCFLVLQYSRLQLIPEEIAKLAYYLFAGITFTEVTLKVIAYSPSEYFRSKWNAFDCVVLIVGGTEMTLLEVDNPVLFTLRTYKLIKVIVCCKTCNYLKHIMGSSLFLFKHPVSILLVFMTICIVTGMQLYGYEYFSAERFPGQEPPRWYFKDCYSSFLLVFCMLCGDWKQPMVNTVLFTSCASDLLMLIFVITGNFVVMNLFLGLVFYAFYYKSLSRGTSKEKLQNAIQVILQRQEKISDDKVNSRETKTDEPHTSNSASSEILSDMQDNMTQPFRKNKKRKHVRSPKEMEILEDTSSEYMADCCPSLCYFCCSFCKADENPVLWQNWADIRCKLYCFVETRLFRVAVSLVILMSVAMMIVDRSYGIEYPRVVKVIAILDPCVFFLFLLEMVLKWMAYGLQKFFKSHMGRFEFFIILIYLVDLLSIKFFDGQKNVFKALRSFRLLSLTPLLKSYQETVPLPMKRNSCIAGSETASRESLLHLKQLECNHFLGKHCRYRPSGSGEIFQMDWNMPDVQPCDLTGSKMRRIEMSRGSDYSDKRPADEVDDCLPSFCYKLFPWCKKDCGFTRCWTGVRTKILIAVKSNIFLGCIIVVIVVSSVFLAVEASFSSGRPALVTKMSCYADRVLAAVFLTEVLFKMLAFGIRTYFLTFWCVVEFIVAFTSAAYAALDELGWGNYPVLKLIRVFRLLYLYKVLGFNKQSQLLLKSMTHALPSYILVFLFVFYLWLAFAILGSAVFTGKLYQCVDSKDRVMEYFSEELCVFNNGTYKRTPVNFDSIENSYIALLQVATLQNWISLVTGIMDNSNQANQMKNQIYTATFFPSFIMFSTFLTLNFFVGVTCCYFIDLKRDLDTSPSAGTKKLYKAAIKKMERTKLKKAIPPPMLPFQAFLYRMVTSDNFEIAGFVFIGLHMLLIALDMYDPDPSEMFALAMTELNIFFIVIFSVECVLKVVAFRHHYFVSLWNHFDVLVLALCICGVLFENLFPSPMLPAMLRLLRFVKCRRYLRRYARGMLPLTYSLYASIPAFFALVVLQFVVMFIYGVFGVYSFQRVEQLWDISGELCFETFPKAMLLLFQLSTLAGWIDVLQSLLESGEVFASAVVFVVSYVVVVYYVIIKTHLVIIIDSFDTAMHEYENILLDEDYDMFAEVWQKFDHNARGIIKFGNLPDLLDVLEEPFHFGKPNRFLIATLNIPIYEGDLIFYADVMDALTRDFMSHKAHLLEVSDSIPGLLDNKGKTLKKIGSSLWRQRQNHCAYIIQRSWRHYTGRLTQSPVFYSEVRLADQGYKVDTFLTAEVRSSSHASV